MDHKEFLQYMNILKERPFALYPVPKGVDEMQNGYLRAAKYNYVDDTPTHVIIQNDVSSKSYHIPLLLIEFINPGWMRLKRELTPVNGDLL
jgi:hypothetical protein